MAAGLEVYEITAQEDFYNAVDVLLEGYEEPLNSFWEVLKGHSADELKARFWKWHNATPGSTWIGVRRKDDATIGVAEWVLFESNPYANGNTIPQSFWWSDDYLTDITQQTLNIFFGRRPKHMSRPHLLLNICCVSKKSRREGAGKLLMNWGKNLADEKGLETFVEATLTGVRLYEATGFVQIEPFLLDAQLPEKFEGEKDKKAWLEARNRIFPLSYPVVELWRPKGGDWKRGDELQV